MLINVSRDEVNILKDILSEYVEADTMEVQAKPEILLDRNRAKRHLNLQDMLSKVDEVLEKPSTQARKVEN